jgi:hypothetical protein
MQERTKALKQLFSEVNTEYEKLVSDLDGGSEFSDDHRKTILSLQARFDKHLARYSIDHEFELISSKLSAEARPQDHVQMVVDQFTRTDIVVRPTILDSVRWKRIHTF